MRGGKINRIEGIFPLVPSVARRWNPLVTPDDNFSSEQDAALWLFKDVTARLRAEGVRFVAVGGWVTWFFHRESYGHPGTLDVDVLLEPKSLEDGSFEAGTERMLGEGYLRAAKNRFQIHRVLRVQGERLIFHADFLNEQGSPDEIDLVVGTGRLQSVYTPAMRLVLEEARFRTLSETEWPGLSEVRFPTVDTFIATKAAAALVKKRRRDAFDIFVSLTNEGPAVVGKRWRELQEAQGMYREAADLILEAVKSGNALEKVKQFLREEHHGKVEGVFREFLRATNRNLGDDLTEH